MEGNLPDLGHVPVETVKVFLLRASSAILKAAKASVKHMFFPLKRIIYFASVLTV